MANQAYSDNNPTAYTFLDFEINPHARELKQGEKPVKISKKSFDILLLLINKQGQVVTKQEIIDHVWPNQIVTDAALNKQLTRLRSDLMSNNASGQAIIETVRGVGVKLLPAVQSLPINTPHNKFQFIAWLLPITVVFFMLFATDVFKNNPKVQKPLTNEVHQLKSFNIALMPSKNVNDWLNVGGLNFLSQQLRTHSEIQTINPHTEWFNGTNTQGAAIEMSQAEKIDYVLSVNNLIKDEHYIADVALRKKTGILAKETIQASSLSGLFEKVESWVIRQLKISTTLAEGQFNGYKPTDFALESYLRSLEAAKNNSYEKAAGLAQTAIDEDTHFFAAWLLLIEVELQLGNYNKAQALINTLERNKDFDKNILNDLYNAKALTLFYLNQLEASGLALDKSIQLSQQKNDNHALIKSLSTKAMLDFNSNNIGEHTVSTLKKMLRLIKQHDPDPYKIAVASLNLASVYQATGQPQPAIKYVKVAIDIFESENNTIGVVSSTSILARIYNELANPEKALLELETTDKYFSQIDAYLVQMRYLNNKIEAQLYAGFSKQAEQNIQQLMALGLNNSGNEAKVIALILLVDKAIIYQNFNAAKPHIKQLLQILKSQADSFPPVYKEMIMVYEMTVAALTENPEQARIKIQEILKPQPSIESNYRTELNLIEAILLEKEGFKNRAVSLYRQVMNDYIKKNNIRYALNTGFHILDVQWHNDKQDYVKTMNYLNEISLFKYPIHKYKAQYLAHKKEYRKAYVMMEDLKSKANQFWTTKDQILLEKYQQMAQSQPL